MYSLILICHVDIGGKERKSNETPLFVASAVPHVWTNVEQVVEDHDEVWIGLD